MGDSSEVKTDREKLAKGVSLPSGKKHRLVVEAMPPFKKLYWSRKDSLVGDEVELVAELKEGVPVEEPIRLTVFEHDADGTHDRVVELPARRVSSPPRATACWKVRYVDDSDDPGYDTLPEFFFEATTADDFKEKSGQGEDELLSAVHALSVRLVDHAGFPVRAASVEVTLPDGSRRTESLAAGDGLVFVRPVPPGVCCLLVKGSGEAAGSRCAEAAVPTVDAVNVVIRLRVPVLVDPPAAPPDDLFKLPEPKPTPAPTLAH